MRTLGASRRQVLTSIVVEALVIGVARVGRRALPRPRAREGALQALRRRRLHAAEQRPHRSQTRTIVVSLLVGDPRHAGREPAAGDPRDARAADRRRARGRDAAAVAVRALPHARLDPAHRRRVRRARSTGSSGSGLGTTGVLALDGRRRAADLLRRRAARRARSCGRFARLLGWPATRIGGAAGSLARDNARRNPQRTASTASALMIGLALVTLVAVLAAGITPQLPRRRRQDLAQRRLRDHGAEQLLARSRPRPPTRPRRRPVVEAVGNVRTGDAEAFGKAFFATAVNPAASTMFTLDWSQGSQQTMARARRQRRVRRQGLREEPPPERRLAGRAHLRERRPQDVRRQGHLRSADAAARRSAA